MSLIRMSVVESCRAMSEDINDLLMNENTSNGSITTTKTFCDRGDVRYNSLLLKSKKSACSANAAHNLIKNHDHSVLVADGSNSLEVAGRGSNTTCRRANDCFRDESGDILGTNS